MPGDRALARLALRIEAARNDPDAFAEYVLKDESTQKFVRQAPHHRRWQKTITDNPRVVLFAPVEHGKTSQAVARVLWEIGRNPLIHIAYISATARQAEKFLAAVRQYIEHSAEYHHVFPGAVPPTRPDEKWTQTSITVERPPGIRDPTVQALGVGGPIQGARLDLVIIDDILDFDNTLTQDQRQKTIGWYDSTVTGRMMEGGKVVVIGTPWHPADFMHALSRRSGWVVIRDSAIVDGKPLWPARWSLERLAERKEEYGSVEFSRQMLCLARDDSSSRFREEWIAKCKRRGAGKTLVARYEGPLPTVTGIDLAVQQGEENDLTVLFTIALHPDGSRELLNIMAGKWPAPEIARYVLDVNARYRPCLVMVENNAAQDYMRQWLQSYTAVPVRGYTTGRTKAHPTLGVESLAVETENGKWIIPSDQHGRSHPEVEAWVNEMLFYSASAHTGDRLMASFFAREAARQVGSVGVAADFGNLMAR